VAFRIQDLMMDVRPGGLQMANPECTCQVTAKQEIQQEPETPFDEEPDSSGDDLEEGVDALAAGLDELRAQLRRDLGQGA
jgi:hypothetical protein